METLILAHHRNQYYSSSKSEFPDRFGSSPLRGFRDVNCRTFQSGAGTLPFPHSFQSPCTNKRASVSPCRTLENVTCSEENGKHSRTRVKSNAIPIVSKASENGSSHNDNSSSELWAGPAYSNSPPPSSLPIPKFSLRQKRSISLDLPSSSSGIKIHPIAKSAPSSPTRESHSSASSFFFSTASATEDLRRILHLDVSDD